MLQGHGMSHPLGGRWCKRCDTSNVPFWLIWGSGDSLEDGPHNTGALPRHQPSNRFYIATELTVLVGKGKVVLALW